MRNEPGVNSKRQPNGRRRACVRHAGKHKISLRRQQGLQSVKPSAFKRRRMLAPRRSRSNKLHAFNKRLLARVLNSSA